MSFPSGEYKKTTAVSHSSGLETLGSKSNHPSETPAPLLERWKQSHNKSGIPCVAQLDSLSPVSISCCGDVYPPAAFCFAHHCLSEVASDNRSNSASALCGDLMCLVPLCSRTMFLGVFSGFTTSGSETGVDETKHTADVAQACKAEEPIGQISSNVVRQTS